MHPNSNTPIPIHNTSDTNFSQSNRTQLETQIHNAEPDINIRKVLCSHSQFGAPHYSSSQQMPKPFPLPKIWLL